MEKYQWDLSPLYKGTDDETLIKDIEKMENLVKGSQVFFDKEKEEEKILREGISLMEEIVELVEKTFAYLQFVLAADTSNGKALGLLNRGRKVLAKFNGFEVKFSRVLGEMNLDSYLEKEEFKPYSFVLKEMQEGGKHLLSEAEEEILAEVSIYGTNAWENLFDQLTSKASAEYRGEEKNLTELRNLAYDPDPKVRKEAYEAELKVYPKIEDSLAVALTSIKGHVNTIARKRGYKDAIEETLDKSRMDRKTLDALIQAMEENLDIFHRYFKAKAKGLGKEKLPWEDLFAPMGKVPAGYSVPLSQRALVESFEAIHPPIAKLMDQAYNDNWIDFFPRKGKVGGAFCENLGSIKQSRILTNFDGSFNAVDTLAHELGHAYHGYLIEDKSPLNRSYSMPVAETASTFNEFHFLLDTLEKAKNEEDYLGLIESFLMGNAQTICDILSRYLFEKEVFERVDDEILSAKELCDIMHRAQVKAYGEGVEEESLHPYMWACKGHYYSAALSYYNFPYAFGSLYAMALYTEAKEKGPEFMEKYDAMLSATTTSTVEDVGAVVDMDLRNPEFWKNAMKTFEPYVKEFEKLVK
ncbi:M3 family oligoendopeptidase [Peptoniphilus sp. KCTC 25270]|uniref:M3 family oligoendopeptidase n=1 Tax=Peptoniphilus sp. KCTC 25270 TaxID=2897414 RepID=UPI001E45C426|nr:M3 family oligoendopeptidase [Peptoniphilus sp. KCTC 25270]MCD1147666.1 M3 family oligoendopeptidase [Peptoniphilus sp. KCTC 25270]